MSHHDKPVLGVTLGDAAGIGPELIAKVLASGFLAEHCKPVIIGDGRVLAAGMGVAGSDFPVRTIARPEEADWSDGFGGAWLVDTGDVDPSAITPGQVNGESGKRTGDTLIRAINLFKQGSIHGIVFAPLNKAAMKKGGYDYESEHVLFANQFGVTTPYGEINVMGDLMTSRVTSHVPIREVADLLSVDSILDAIHLLHATQAMAGRPHARLAVAGLNPHNGENGTCGREEIDVIAPAVERAWKEGINVSGPYSADVLFLRAFNGEFDAVVTMYHDQGQIAIKLKGFDCGVTVAGGMPAPVTTPAHGTAFDIVGKNKARTGATEWAIRLAAQMARHGVLNQ